MFLGNIGSDEQSGQMLVEISPHRNPTIPFPVTPANLFCRTAVSFNNRTRRAYKLTFTMFKGR